MIGYPKPLPIYIDVYVVSNVTTSNRVHYVQQTLITVYIVVHHITCRHLVKQLLCTRDFRLLNGTQFKAFHCAFCFGYEENVLDLSLIESDCPVRRIVAHRRRDLEGSRQLGIDTNPSAASKCSANFLSMLLSDEPSVNT